MSNRLLDDLRSLLRRIERDEEMADQLWTWLPSYAAARRHYGDYATEHTPTPADVMHEAAMLLACREGYGQNVSDVLTWFYCDLDDCDDLPSETTRLNHIESWFADRGMTFRLKGCDYFVIAQKETL